MMASVARKMVGALTASHHLDLLRRKLPSGVIWRHQFTASGTTYPDGNPKPKTRFGQFLWGCADEFTYLHGRLRKLWDEAWPGTADEMLDDWEDVLGLPFAGYPTPATNDERRAVCETQYLAKGALTTPYLEDLATPLGVDATVTNHPDKVLCIVVSCPDEFARADCNCECNAPLVDLTDVGARYAAFVDRYHAAGREVYYTDEVMP